MKNRFPFAVLLLIFLVYFSSGQIKAMGLEGRVEVIFKSEQCVLPGAEFTLYEVTDFSEVTGIESTEMEESCISSFYALSNDSKQEVLKKAETYFQEHPTSGTVMQTDSQGVAKFENVTEGIYFLVQSEPYSFDGKQLTSVSCLFDIPYSYGEGEKYLSFVIEPKVSEKDPYPEPDDEMPQTGDEADEYIWIAGIIIASIAILAWVSRRRGKHDTKDV